MSLKHQKFHISDLVIDDEYGLIDSEATVVEAAKKMKELAIPDLVVLEKGTEKVLGVIADFDIVQNVVAAGKDPAKEKVTSPMYTITPVTLNTDVVEAFERMRDLHVNVVPVVENDKLLGVCTIQDVWSYIPDENVDEIGMIPVSDPKMAEFWFASIASTLALVLGILLPLVGVVGYFSGAFPAINNERPLNFFLLDAHGGDFYISYVEAVARFGIWVLVIICSILTILVGIVGFFAIIAASFSDYQKIRSNRLIRTILPYSMIAVIVLQWIAVGIAVGVSTVPGSVTINGLGLFFSLFAILLIIAAIKRDYVFKQSAKLSSSASSATLNAGPSEGGA